MLFFWMPAVLVFRMCCSIFLISVLRLPVPLVLFHIALFVGWLRCFVFFLDMYFLLLAFCC